MHVSCSLVGDSWDEVVGQFTNVITAYKNAFSSWRMLTDIENAAVSATNSES